MGMKKIIEEIVAERARQNKKFGQQNHNLPEWMAILMEEVGEASREAVDWHFQYPPKHQTSTPFEAIQKNRLKNYRKELIQVAAVAVSMVEALDRQEKRKADVEYSRNR